MSKPLETIAGPRCLADVVAFASAGMFHASFDGRWRHYRYSKPADAVYYVDTDPASFLPLRKALGDQWAAADPASGIYARGFSDGTCAFFKWEGMYSRAAFLIDAPLDKADGKLRDWIAGVMP